MTPSLSGLPPIRTALIGYGFAGKTFHAPLIRAVPALCLEHVVSRDPGRVHADLPEARVSADPDEAIEAADIDLVVIASPNATHASLAERALRAGKHVVVDKPFTVTLAEARRLADLARERPGQVLSVFQNRRFDSDFLAVEAALQAGSIGPVRYFESAIERFRPQVRDRWREHDLPGSGLWFDLGPHLLDQALCLFGIPQRVHGHLRRLREGAQTDDWFEVLLDYPHCQVALRASMLAANPAPRFNVHGDHGSLLKAGADIQEAQLLRGTAPRFRRLGPRSRPAAAHRWPGPAPVAGHPGRRPEPLLPGAGRRHPRPVAQPGVGATGLRADGPAGVGTTLRRGRPKPAGGAARRGTPGLELRPGSPAETARGS